MEGEREGALLEAGAGAEPGGGEAAGGGLGAVGGSGWTVVIDVFRDGVEGRPGGVPDGGDLLADPFLEEAKNLAPRVLRSGLVAVSRIGKQVLDELVELRWGRVMAGQSMELGFEVVVETVGDAEDFLGLTNLRG